MHDNKREGLSKTVAIGGFICFLIIAAIGAINRFSPPQDRPGIGANTRPIELETIVKERERAEAEQRRAAAEQRLRQKCHSEFARLEQSEARQFPLRRKGRDPDIGCLYSSSLPDIFGAYERLRVECASLISLPRTLNGRTLRDGLAAEDASCGQRRR